MVKRRDLGGRFGVLNWAAVYASDGTPHNSKVRCGGVILLVSGSSTGACMILDRVKILPI